MVEIDGKHLFEYRAYQDFILAVSKNSMLTQTLQMANGKFVPSYLGLYDIKRKKNIAKITFAIDNVKHIGITYMIFSDGLALKMVTHVVLLKQHFLKFKLEWKDE